MNALVQSLIHTFAPWQGLYGDSKFVSALVVLFVSGLAMAAADVETFAKSPVFAAKLGVVFLLLINGLFLRRTERSLERLTVDQLPADEAAAERRRGSLWQRMRATAWASAALWTAAVVIGVVLTDAA